MTSSSLPETNNQEPTASFLFLIPQYQDALRVKGYSSVTVKIRRQALRLFVVWCAERGIDEPREVSRSMIERYQRHMLRYRKADGKPISYSTQSQRLIAVRSFFSWLVRSGQIEHNPSADIELPKRERRLPRHILSIAEVETVLSQPDLAKPLGVRDRAILETFYSSGIRRAELAGLQIFDVDAGRGALMVRQGKGGTDRVVPIGERALAWIDRYLVEVRPQLLGAEETSALYLGLQGLPLSPSWLTRLVGDYVRESGIDKGGSCHLLRHTAATLMLEGGADIRYIQEMLGHVNLDTTKLYTKVSILELKRVHGRCHPGAKLGRGSAQEKVKLELLEGGPMEEDRDAYELHSA
jgi:integrase/recombinase XerD